MANNTGALLQELFDLFCEQLVEEVRVARDEGLPIPAADKAAIIRFLQVNNMSYVPGDSDALAKLREEMLAKKAAGSSAMQAVASATADLDEISKLYGAVLQ